MSVKDENKDIFRLLNDPKLHLVPLHMIATCFQLIVFKSYFRDWHFYLASLRLLWEILKNIWCIKLLVAIAGLCLAASIRPDFPSEKSEDRYCRLNCAKSQLALEINIVNWRKIFSTKLYGIRESEKIGIAIKRFFIEVKSLHTVMLSVLTPSLRSRVLC